MKVYKNLVLFCIDAQAGERGHVYDFLPLDDVNDEEGGFLDDGNFIVSGREKLNLRKCLPGVPEVYYCNAFLSVEWNEVCL